MNITREEKGRNKREIEWVRQKEEEVEIEIERDTER